MILKLLLRLTIALTIFLSLIIFGSTQIPSSEKPLLIYAASNNYEIYLYEVGTGARLHVGTVSEGNNYNSDAQWSPDGQYIYLLSFPQSEQLGELRITDTQSGKTTLVTEHLRNRMCDNSLLWSPDDQHIAYVENLNDEYQYYIYSVQTEQAIDIPVTNQPGLAEWSADSRQISTVLMINNEFVRQVWNLDGELVETRQLQPERRLSYRLMSSDMRYIILRSEDKIPNAVLDIRRLRLTPLPELSRSQFTWDWNTDDVVINWQEEGPANLSVFDLQEVALYHLSSDEIQLQTYVFSPDRSKVAVERWHSQQEYMEFAVWDMQLNQWIFSTTITSGIKSKVNWSQNGQYLFFDVYFSGSLSEDAGVFLLDVNTQEVVKLLDYNADTFIHQLYAWSPDGQYIAFVTGTVDSNGFATPHYALYIVDVVKKIIKHIPGSYPPLFRVSDISNLNWSPNGQFLSAQEPDKTVIIDIINEERFELVNTRQEILKWVENGRFIAVLQRNNNDTDIVLFDSLKRKFVTVAASSQREFIIGWRNEYSRSLFTCPSG